MIDLDQEIEVLWNPTTLHWYEEKGYEFTKYGDKFIVKAKDLMTKSDAKVSVICDYCGQKTNISYKQYNQCTKNDTEKYACKDCRSKKQDEHYFTKIREKQYNLFIKTCEQRGHISLSKLNDYKNINSKAIIICPTHGKFETTFQNYLYSKTGCIECGQEETKKNLKLSIEEVISLVESKNNNKIKNPEDYINFSTPNLVITCGSCGNDFVTSLASLNCCGSHCMDCGRKYLADLQRLSSEDVKERINSVNGNVLLNSEEYATCNKLNLRILCSCGEEYCTSLNNYMAGANRCPKCRYSISSGELMVSKILDEFNISYIREYRFNDCRDLQPLPFDFYLPTENKIIEFDGQGHFQVVYSEEQLLKTQKHDKIKDKYCHDNNIPILRIPFWEGNNAKDMISNFLNLTKFKKIIRYNKNPYKE